MTTDAGPVRKLVQVNGTVEDMLAVSVCPASSFSGSPQQFEFTYSSSSREVLPGPSETDESNPSVEFSIVQSFSCTNVSVFLTFDALVGITVFSIIALDPISRDQLCSSSIEYVIVGISVYEAVSLFGAIGRQPKHSKHVPNRDNTVRQQTPILSDASDGTAYVLHSGIDNSMVLDYTDAVQSPTREFLFKAQFPDGSDSSTKPSSFVSQILQSVVPRVESDATSPVRFDDALCALVRVNSSDSSEGSSSEDSCGIAITVSLGLEPTFKVRFQPYKDGTSTFLFSWPALTAGDQNIEDDVFETVVVFQVIGGPPPLVESIAFPDTLFRAGGQPITLIFDNSEGSRSRVLRVGEFEFLEISGSYRRLESGLFEATYESSAGNGTNIPYTLEVSYITGNIGFSRIVNGSVQAQLSYVTVPLIIGSISPPWGENSEEIVLRGFFDMFDPSRPGHHLYIGEKSITELGVVPVIDHALGIITLNVPSREAAGSAYVYPVRVVINREETNVVSFSYIPEPLVMTIDVLGGSQNVESDEYLVGICEYTQYRLRLPSGSREPDSVFWKLQRKVGDELAEAGRNLFTMFPDISIRNQSILIPPTVFTEIVGSFVIQVDCEVYGRSLNASVEIRTTGVPVIGVDLPRIPTRSIGLPNLPSRVNAIVTIPVGDCYSSVSSVVYEWTFDNLTRIFSSDNPPTSIDENDVRPGRLGREFIIPQSRLRYGVFPIILSVYLKDNSLISGNATTTLTVKRSKPVAVIGSGALQINHGAGSDLFIRANSSYAPDSAFDLDATIVWYSWSCELSTAAENGSLSTTCPSAFLPLGSISNFSVSSSILVQTRERLFPGDKVSSFHVTYSLRVGTFSAASAVTFQTIEILPSLEVVPVIFQVDLLTGRGTAVNWKLVRFYNELVIYPKGAGIFWTFSVLEPLIDVGLFESPVNLLQYKGYYNPEENSSQSYPLGIKANSLRPAQTYQIAITSYSGNRTGVSGLTVVQFETVDRPRLVLPPLVRSEGNISTIYSASAQVNLDSDGLFFFFFFLVGEDGKEICIDGCSGRSTVQFRVLETGTFRLLVKLRDVEGTSILDEQFFTSNITVLALSNGSSASSPSSSNELIGTLESWLRDAYRFGDHGAVEQISFVLARMIRNYRSDDLPTNATATLTLSLGLMYNVISNSVPNALTARSYIQTLNQFARVDSHLLQDVDSLLVLLDAADETLLRVPITEALDVLEELLMFYNLTARHALDPFLGADMSSRVGLLRPKRLTESAGFTANSIAHTLTTVTLDKRLLLIDFFTMLQKHLSLVLSRDAVCGSTQTVNTSVPGGLGFVDTTRNDSMFTIVQNSSHLISIFGQDEIPVSSTFSLAVVCDPFDVNRIEGHKSQFSWCNDFAVTQEEGFYSSLEISPSPDFPSSSHEPSTGQPPFLQDELSERQIIDITPPRMDTTVNLSKRLYTLMETMDYTWLSGLTGDDVKTSAAYLLTINTLSLSGNEFFRLSSPTKNCYNLNTSVPKLGRTEGGGCLGVKGFTVDIETEAEDDQTTKRPWRITRSFDNVVAKLSVDGTSSLVLEPTKPRIVGAILDSCPIDLQKPEVELPEKIDQFSYIIIGTAVGTGTIVTLTWIGTSAQYATFTGATVVAI